LDRNAVSVVPCGPTAQGLTLGAGRHVIRTRPGQDTGIDLDRLVLSSDAGGAASALGADGRPVPPSSGAAVASLPRVKVTHDGETSMTARITGARQPFWLVLGQSNNAGWTAKANGHSLGAPTLIDGYANGWRIDPSTTSLTVTMTWTPQGRVWVAL